MLYNGSKLKIKKKITNKIKSNSQHGLNCKLGKTESLELNFKTKKVMGSEEPDVPWLGYSEAQGATTENAYHHIKGLYCMVEPSTNI